MAEYIIAQGGKSSYYITTHQYADETVRFAASELQKYLLKATNAFIPYYSDLCEKAGPEIRVGALVRGETEELKNFPEDSYAILAAGENITVTGTTSRGVLYGVYRFLELFCGFQCYTKEVEVIDRIDTLKIELTEIIEKPRFEYRDAYFTPAFDGDFAAKNRLNGSLADLSQRRGGRTKWYNFHHAMFDLVPPDKYFDTHPEYFSEHEGVRIRKGQLCLSNSEVAKIAEQTLRGWIADNPECRVFSVAQNDDIRRCTCPECLAIEEEEGSPAGPIIRFTNKLADAIREDYPDVLLHTFAYQYSLPAPKYAVARDNVIVRLYTINCSFDKPISVRADENPVGKEKLFEDSLKAWKSHAKRLYVWDYAVNFRNYLQPFIHLHTMAENIRYFDKNGVSGILEQGNFAYGGGASMDELKSYLIAKLLWNPLVDVDKAISEFVTAVYGVSAAPYIMEYLSLAEKTCSSDALYIYQDPDVSPITDTIVEKYDELFSKAIEATSDARCRARLVREYLAVRFLKISRMPLDACGREELIEEFFSDVKRFGITEVRERIHLDVSLEYMKKNRYTKDDVKRKRIYYIMK